MCVCVCITFRKDNTAVNVPSSRRQLGNDETFNVSTGSFVSVCFYAVVFYFSERLFSRTWGIRTVAIAITGKDCGCAFVYRFFVIGSPRTDCGRFRVKIRSNWPYVHDNIVGYDTTAFLTEMTIVFFLRTRFLRHTERYFVL